MKRATSPGLNTSLSSPAPSSPREFLQSGLRRIGSGARRRADWVQLASLVPFVPCRSPAAAGVARWLLHGREAVTCLPLPRGKSGVVTRNRHGALAGESVDRSIDPELVGPGAVLGLPARRRCSHLGDRWSGGLLGGSAADELFDRESLLAVSCGRYLKTLGYCGGYVPGHGKRRVDLAAAGERW